MLHVVGPFGDQLPAACQNSCQEAWSIFDVFISKFAFDYDTSERATRVLRHGVTLFGQAALSVASSVLSRMATSFEATGFSSFLWISGKIIGRFGHEADPALRNAFQSLYERATNKVVSLLQSKDPRDIPDGDPPFLPILVPTYPASTSPRGLRSALDPAHTDGAGRFLSVQRIPSGIPSHNGCPYSDSF